MLKHLFLKKKTLSRLINCVSNQEHGLKLFKLWVFLAQIVALLVKSVSVYIHFNFKKNLKFHSDRDMWFWIRSSVYSVWVSFTHNMDHESCIIKVFVVKPHGRWSWEDTDYEIWYLITNTGCPRRNGQNFWRVFLMLNYTDITQNTYIQNWMVTEIMASEVWNFDSCYTLIDYQIHIKTGRNMWFL